MIQISEHYLPYAPNTYIVVVSADRARVLRASERTVEEVETLEAEHVHHDRENAVYEDGHAEGQEEHKRHALYKLLSERLVQLKPDSIVLCTPEAHQKEIQEQLPKELLDKVSHLIPKNLASLPIDSIVRILQERQA